MMHQAPLSLSRSLTIPVLLVLGAPVFSHPAASCDMQTWFTCERPAGCWLLAAGEVALRGWRGLDPGLDGTVPSGSLDYTSGSTDYTKYTSIEYT